jgi:pyruvate, orthophosphate dikinase
MAKKKYVYFYGFGKEQHRRRRLDEGDFRRQGRESGRDGQCGLPVPPGFTVSTEACAYYSKQQQVSRRDVGAGQGPAQEARDLMGKKLGDPKNPLLVSVRSGAAISMPGMMDTVLNLGLNDKSVLGFIERPATRARAGTATAASSTCSATWSWAPRPA